MDDTEQTEFDFSPVGEHIARMQAQAQEEFSEVNLCIAWVTQSDLPLHQRVDSRNWRGWWDGLPSYERSRHLDMYRFEREFSADGPMRPFSRVNIVIDPEVERMEQESVERWAAEIRQAAVEGRPMPFAESEFMTPMELLAFRSKLTEACQIAGAFIITAAPEQEEPKRRKVRSKSARAQAA